ENEVENLEFGADSLGVGADSLVFGTDSLNVGRDSLNTGRDSLNIDRGSVGAGRDSLNVDRGSIGADRDSLDFGRDSLNMGRDSLDFGRDSLGMGQDSLGFGSDSLGFASDSLAGPLDTTKVNFLWANRNIKLFREDMQMVCDSLEYCDLDSLTRMYQGTIIWNEITQQYSADSVMVVFRNGAMEKANLMSNSYIIIEEETDLYFDQIKSVESIAYFDGDGNLSRFDALGTANGAFFLREEEVVATVNKTESKMLSAVFENGEINKVYYFQEVESDAYPVVQLPQDEQTYKGFLWQPELRPDSPEAVTHRKARPSMRGKYKSHPRADFEFTEIYFPGYIPGVYLEMEQKDSLSRVNAARRREAEALREQFLADSLQQADLFNLIDSITVVNIPDSLFFADSLAKADRKVQREEKKQQKAAADSVSRADSIAEAALRVPTKEELKAIAVAKKAAEKEAARIQRELDRVRKAEEKEARWAMMDSLDAAKVTAKQEKAAEKLRKKKLKTLTKADAAYEVEEAILEKYVQRIEKKEAKKEAKEAERAAKRAAKNKPPKKSKGDSGGETVENDGEIEEGEESDVEESGEIRVSGGEIMKFDGIVREGGGETSDEGGEDGVEKMVVENEEEEAVVEMEVESEGEEVNESEGDDNIFGN
ncbi:MAG: hypothetical protein LUD72_11955, partial [Bacteroidales bacterium]|nr:hypothetical protein [Bacteroidales bacterium]